MSGEVSRVPPRRVGVDADTRVAPVPSHPSRPTLVFVHGGCHRGSAWDATLAALRAEVPDIAGFAVDLPGRGDSRGDLAALTLDSCAAAVTADIDARVPAGHPVVLVGHSLGGVVIPRVANRLGSPRVQRIIFVAACVPPPGQSVLDTVPKIVAVLARRVLRRPVIPKVPFLIERFIFGNRASCAQRREIHRHCCAESVALITEVSPPWSLRDIPLGWVVPTHDRAMPPRAQHEFIRRLGVDRVASIDGGHEVLITHPAEVAEAILDMFAP